jgi:RNA polymerase sigma factor (sigma-70 family)
VGTRGAAAGSPAGPELDDVGWRQLCVAIRRGDEHAFARFYDLWFDRALRLARAVVHGDEAAGLDVVQDVMVKVVHKLPALAGERAVAAWMAKTISAAAIDRRRSDERRRRRESVVAQTAAAVAGHDALRQLGDNEQLGWLRAQLAGLTADERLLLQQRFDGEPSLGEVAAALGLSADAVQGRVRRLLLRLRCAAKEWYGDA